MLRYIITCQTIPFSMYKRFWGTHMSNSEPTSNIFFAGMDCRHLSVMNNFHKAPYSAFGTVRGHFFSRDPAGPITTWAFDSTQDASKHVTRIHYRRAQRRIYRHKGRREPDNNARFRPTWHTFLYLFISRNMVNTLWESLFLSSGIQIGHLRFTF